VFTKPTASTPVGVTFAVPVNVRAPIVPVADTLPSFSIMLTVTVFTAPVALTLSNVSVGFSSTVFTAPVALTRYWSIDILFYSINCTCS